MKKKIIKLFYALFIVILTSGCGNNSEDGVTRDDNVNSDDNYVIVGSVSLLNCNNFDTEEVEKEILTFYYDENERIKEVVETTYWKSSIDTLEDYNESLSDDRYERVKMNNKIVTSKYSKESVKSTYWAMTKSSITELYERCISNPVVEGFEPDID